MDISIRKTIESDLTTFSMLWQFYLYHQSFFDGEEIGDLGFDGRYDIDEKYLREVVQGQDTCEAFIILIGENVAGFLMIEPSEVANRKMKEFADLFILPKYRMKGIAKYIIDKVIISSQEDWHVAVYRDDTEAFNFWKHMFQNFDANLVEKLELPETEKFYEFIINKA